MSDWDRSKQTYFIVRRGEPWHVRTVDGTRHVADWPAYYSDEDAVRNVCFAANDDDVLKIIAELKPKRVVHHVLMWEQGAITESELFLRVREQDGRDCLPEHLLPPYDRWCEDHPLGPNTRTFHMGSFTSPVTVFKPAYRELTIREASNLGTVNPFVLMEFALHHLGQAISVADGFSIHKTPTGMVLHAVDVDTTDNKEGTVSRRDLIEVKIDPTALDDLAIWEQYNPEPTDIDPELPDVPA